MKKQLLGLVLGISISFGFLSLTALAQPSNKPVINPPPTAKDWANLAKLPDWSGVWNPFVTDQDKQAKTNMPPWTPKVN